MNLNNIHQQIHKQLENFKLFISQFFIIVKLLGCIRKP